MNLKRIFLLLFVFSLTIPVFSQGTIAPSINQQVINKDVSLKYWTYRPRDYSPDRKWPLLIFLHGAGERGSDLELITRHGPPRLVREGRDFPFLMIAPQCPAGEVWDNDKLYALINRFIDENPVDRKRIYLTGLSMGGYGTWSMAMDFPELFAALVPIAGGGMTWRANLIKEVPVWVFHGAKDEIVPIENSLMMVEALERQEAKVKFTIYPDARHDSWTNTYQNQELYDWLLAHSLKED